MVYPNDKILLKALDTSPTWKPPKILCKIVKWCQNLPCFPKNSGELTKLSDFLTAEEKKGICQIIKAKLSLTSDPDKTVLYNYCRFYLILTGSTSRVDLDKSTFGMSRSLSLYLFFLVFYFVFKTIQCQECKYFGYAALCLMLSVLFFFRCIRFAKMRIIYTLRSCYYSLTLEKSKGSVKAQTAEPNIKL